MAPNKRLHWDGTVTAGNVMTAAVLLVALLAGWFRLEGRVDQNILRIDRNEQQIEDAGDDISAAVMSLENRVVIQMGELRSDISELRAVLLGRADAGRLPP